MTIDLAVIEYLTQNEGYGSHNNSSDKKHESLIGLISSNPVRFGIPRDVVFFREVYFDGRPAIPYSGVVDLAALAQQDSVPQEIYLLEVKGVYSTGKSSLATTQLHNAFHFFHEKFGIMPHLIKVYRSKGAGRLVYTEVKAPINRLDALLQGMANSKI